MSRRFYIAGLLFGLTGILLGAFATHGLKPLLSPEAITSFETGVKYQIYHALLLLVLGNCLHLTKKISNRIFFLIISGVFLFSGSIYVLATNSLTAFNFKVLALLTPLGGSLLILAWGLLLVYFLKLKNK